MTSITRDETILMITDEKKSKILSSVFNLENVPMGLSFFPSTQFGGQVYVVVGLALTVTDLITFLPRIDRVVVHSNNSRYIDTIIDSEDKNILLITSVNLLRNNCEIVSENIN